MKTILLFVGLSGVVFSCADVYKYDAPSPYLVQSKGKFRTFSPEMIYYGTDYSNERMDTVKYVRTILSSETSEQWRYKKDGQTISYESSRLKEPISVKIAINKKDTIWSDYFLPDFLFKAWVGRSTNGCSLIKLDEKKPVYYYVCIGDTLIPGPVGVRECLKVEIGLKNQQFLPFYFNIDKETGVPISFSYPYCDINDGELVYLNVRMQARKRVFFLNKYKICW